MSDTNQKITHLLGQQIPDYVQEYYPMFVIFLTKYFEFLENTSTGVQYTIQNIRLNRDIDTTATQLANQFLNTYVPNLPSNSELDQAMLVKNFRDFYQRKGSEKSFRFFFKAFFNDDIEIDYPRNYMFATSDGDWYKETSVRVQSNVGDPFALVHTKIYGSSSGAYATVNKVIQVSGLGSADYYDLVLQPYSWVGAFTSGETITGISYNFDANTSSQIYTTSVTGVLVADGRYLNSNSHLSNDQRLQDSLYYQQFSYVIKTRQDRETWADHVLNHLHPTGTVLFNEYLSDTVSTNATSSFVKTNQVETTVKIPTVKSYLAVPTFTFDRTGDAQTGTSTTQLATTTGFATVTYTSIGDVTYDANYDYSGENITWGLQQEGDAALYGGAVTEIIRFGGASFDKLYSTLGSDVQFIAWPRDVNSSLAVTRISLGSSNLSAGALVTSFTTTPLTLNIPSFPTATSVGSMILLLTWNKNARGNNAAGESNNAVVLTLSSNVTVVPYFDEYTQRNYSEIALARSIDYNKLFYVHSSNSISANITSGLPLTSTVSNARIVFKPYNWERGNTYDRLAVRIEVDQQIQLNTSLTETFTTANITASGLIASWSSVTTGASVSYFGNNSSSTFTFSSNCFIINGAVGETRYIQSTSFTNTQLVEAQIRYAVGDGSNGGDAPEFSEDLELQYTMDGGANWYAAIGGGKIWSAAETWTYGQDTIAGTVWTAPGSDYVTGVNTIFSTEFVVGDRFTIASSTTTTYTVVAVLNNNVMEVSPQLVDDFRNPQLVNGTVSTVAGSALATGAGSGWGTYTIGNSFTFGNSALGTTTYSTYLLVGFDQVLVTPLPVNTTSNATAYYIAGVGAYKKKPVAQQFQTTSITVYGPGPATSVIVRVIQLGSGSTPINADTYAIDSFRLDSWRYQNTTGTVSIGIAVSSNSTLNISDTDIFDVTTIGIT